MKMIALGRFFKCLYETAPNGTEKFKFQVVFKPFRSHFCRKLCLTLFMFKICKTGIPFIANMMKALPFESFTQRNGN